MSPSKPVARVAAAQRLPKRAPSSRLADERLQSVIELAADFYWEQDEHFRFTAYRPSGEPDADARRARRQDELGVLQRIAGDRRLGAAHGHARATRAVPRRAALLSATQAGGARYLSFSGQPIFDQRNKFKGYRGIARDVSAQIRADRLARLEHTIAHTLAEADDVAAGLTAVIRAMCEAQGWTAGNFWSVDAQRDTLWHEVGWNAAGDDRRSVLNPGDRLPTLAEPRPGLDRRRGSRSAHVAARACRSDGLEHGPRHSREGRRQRRSAFSISTRRASRRPEPQFLKVLRSASTEIGHFYQRSLALEKLRESEERFSSTMKLAAIGIAHVEDGGRFQLRQPAALRDARLHRAGAARDDGEGGLASRRRQHHRRPARPAALRRDPVVQDGEALSAQGRLADLGGAHDRLQARSRRPVRVRHLGRRRHLLAQGSRRAHPIPRDARRPHGLAESRDVHAAAGAVDRNGAALRPQARRAVHRSRPLQGHQRHAGPRGRRRAAARDGRALARVPARERRRGAPRRRRVRRAAAGDQRSRASGRRRAQHLDRRDEARRHPRPGVPRHGQRRHLPASRRRSRRSVDHEERRHGDVPREGRGQEQLPVLHEPHEAAFDRALGARDEPAPRARAATSSRCTIRRR